jgi:hypothetical protein
MMCCEALKRVVTLRQGMPDECWRSFGRSKLVCASDGSLPCIDSQATANVAARRLAVAVCGPDELSQGKSSSMLDIRVFICCR